MSILDLLITNCKKKKYIKLVYKIYIYKANFKLYLVRFGGAGAFFPFLFVVRRICTPCFGFGNVLNLELDVSKMQKLYFQRLKNALKLS